ESRPAESCRSDPVRIARAKAAIAMIEGGTDEICAACGCVFGFAFGGARWGSRAVAGPVAAAVYLRRSSEGCVAASEYARLRELCIERQAAVDARRCHPARACKQHADPDGPIAS